MMWINEMSTNNNFQADLASFEQNYGRITHYEYRNQGVTYMYGRSELAFSSSTPVTTYYAIKTTMLTGDDLFFGLESVQVPGKEKYVFTNIAFQKWDQKPVPDYLLNPNAPEYRRKCGTVERLKEKIP